MADEYEHVARSKLKLKTDSNKISKKKKKDKKKREKLERELDQEQHYNREKIDNAPQAPVRSMTKAELSFKKMQEKMVNIQCENIKKKCHSNKFKMTKLLPCVLQQEKRIMEKASQTHKQRVEKFNEHLDNLTEHFDIPKVSWTK